MHFPDIQLHEKSAIIYIVFIRTPLRIVGSQTFLFCCCFCSILVYISNLTKDIYYKTHGPVWMWWFVGEEVFRSLFIVQPELASVPEVQKPPLPPWWSSGWLELIPSLPPAVLFGTWLYWDDVDLRVPVAAVPATPGGLRLLHLLGSCDPGPHWLSRWLCLLLPMVAINESGPVSAGRQEQTFVFQPCYSTTCNFRA